MKRWNDLSTAIADVHSCCVGTDGGFLSLPRHRLDEWPAGMRHDSTEGVDRVIPSVRGHRAYVNRPGFNGQVEV